MRYDNPTRIAVGMTGVFLGRTYRVAGRVVLGEKEAGEVYYWNEFNLVHADGGSTTLVYEETERGGEWRLFAPFEPQYPISAAAAAAVRAGATVRLTDKPMRVTLVSESRVYYLEGEAPEGVEVGDVARYFNAQAAEELVVASWTGAEIEFFCGVDLLPVAVGEAFGVPSEQLSLHPPSGRATSSGSGWAGKLVAGVVVAAAMFAFYSCYWPKRPGGAPAKPNTPASPLALGSVGKLDGTTYRVRGHALVEMAEVGRLYDRHEYHLRDEYGNRAVLIYGLKPATKTWFFLSPLQPETPLTPSQAAAKRIGDTVDLGGVQARVTELFRSTLTDTQDEDLPDLTRGDVRYGFMAGSGGTLFLTCWNNTGALFYQGKFLPPKEVAAAFGLPP